MLFRAYVTALLKYINLLNIYYHYSVCCTTNGMVVSCSKLKSKFYRIPESTPASGHAFKMHFTFIACRNGLLIFYFLQFLQHFLTIQSIITWAFLKPL